MCLGAFLAKLELKMVLEQLAVRYPRIKLAIPASKIPYRASTHLHGCYALPIDVGLVSHECGSVVTDPR
ncbi:cytochrome P450 PksS [Micromonospora pattaloongensis]|uniref:Cytochrome P450 PksS n=1 Tax=Micromonospora pattaloongensis TaxID=405436 RepID=A0A1H3PCC6_9ACTN|nr:cytochrome P450 PksS [Micromonospora pattaloongensis]